MLPLPSKKQILVQLKDPHLHWYLGDSTIESIHLKTHGDEPTKRSIRTRASLQKVS